MQLTLSQGFQRCSVCWSISLVLEIYPFIYLRVIQDAVVSLMNGITQEFIDVSTEDGKSQEDELRFYCMDLYGMIGKFNSDDPEFY